MNGNLRHGFARFYIENGRLKVTTGASVGDIPAPFDGGSIVYRVEQDENGNTLNIPYEIDWHDANDEPISSNSIYSASNGTTWTAYGYRPVEYSVTYSGLTLLELRALNNPTSYNAELGLMLTNPEDRAGETEYYQFTGWSGTDITGTSSSVSVARGETGNRSYTANWTKKTSFNVTYNANGGTTSCTKSTGSYKGHYVVRVQQEADIPSKDGILSHMVELRLQLAAYMIKITLYMHNGKLMLRKLNLFII